MNLASIPSPTRSAWHLGPLPIRAYALCIVLGIIVAIIMTSRRWRDRGGQDDQVGDIAAWAVVLGIIGGRLYHVVTSSELYFGKGKNPLNAFRIWEGGLGIWGAIALGGVGVLIGCRRKGVKFRIFADAAAPGVVLAQAFGRWGNWFNNELYGRATDLPWKLEIHQIDLDTGKAVPQANGSLVIGYFQPTFLYESIWCVLVCLALLWADRRFRLGDGRVFALYAVLYSVGRFWIESLRVDEAHHILGLRLNEFTCLVVIIGGLAWLYTHRGPRETSVWIHPELHPADGGSEGPADAAGSDQAAAAEGEGNGPSGGIADGEENRDAETSADQDTGAR